MILQLKLKPLLIIIALFFSYLTAFGQVGIGTTNPLKELDVNGELRVRQINESTTAKDIQLVVDPLGIVKKSIRDSHNVQGILSSNYDSWTKTPISTSASIYHVNNITEIIDTSNDFNSGNGIFKAPVTGVYRVTITLTVSGFETVGSNPNYVTGLINQADKWIMRFSFDKQVFYNSSSVTGRTRTFTGIAELTAGDIYGFGYASDDDFRLISEPTGTSGTGIGSYFEIVLIDN